MGATGLRRWQRGHRLQRVQGAAAGGESTTPLNATPLSPDTTSFPVSGLTDNTTYFFTVTAVNAIGEGSASDEVSATPASAGGTPTAPEAPTAPTATAGDTSVTVAWSPPASDGGSPITGYNVYQGTTTGGESTTPINSTPLSPTAANDLVTSLTNGTEYFFTITAVNAVGESGPSAEVSATPAPLSGATAPGAPSYLKAKGGNHTVSLTWTPAASNGGSAITGYNVVERCGYGRTKLANHHPLRCLKAMAPRCVWWFRADAGSTG